MSREPSPRGGMMGGQPAAGVEQLESADTGGCKPYGLGSGYRSAGDIQSTILVPPNAQATGPARDQGEYMAKFGGLLGWAHGQDPFKAVAGGRQIGWRQRKTRAESTERGPARRGNAERWPAERMVRVGEQKGDVQMGGCGRKKKRK